MSKELFEHRVKQTRETLRALEPWIRAVLLPQSPASSVHLDKARDFSAEAIVKAAMRDDD